MNDQQFSQIQIEDILQEFVTGTSITELCKTHNISIAALYDWGTKYNCLDKFLARIKKLEDENQEMKNAISSFSEQLKHTTQQLDSFTYSVSHDLRAPLRAILGFSRILQDEYTSLINDQEFATLSDRVVSNALKMECQINELVNFSRMLRKDLSKSQIDLDHLVRTILHELTARETTRKFDINVAVLDTVWGDETLMYLAWKNLISNALKFTRKKEVAYIEINCGKKDNAITFSVADNGIGFDMQYAHKLFGVFQRLHKASDFEGTGVGLALTSGIIQRHGGKIWADAEPGKGATFFFTMPVN